MYLPAKATKPTTSKGKFFIFMIRNCVVVLLDLCRYSQSQVIDDSFPTPTFTPCIVHLLSVLEVPNPVKTRNMVFFVYIVKS